MKTMYNIVSKLLNTISSIYNAVLIDEESQIRGLHSLQHTSVRFEDLHRGSIPIQFDGTPFVVISSDILDCQFGPPIKKSIQEDGSDHPSCTKKKVHVNGGKKLNCPAKIKIRRIIKFPEYKIQGQNTKYRRLESSKQLRKGFCLKTEQTCVVYVQFIGQHSDHVIGELTGYGNRVDKDLTSAIKALAKDGITNIPEIQRRCEHIADDIFPCAPSNTDRRFHPTRKDIYNVLYSYHGETRCSREDQRKLSELVDEWKHKEDGNIFFRPMSEESSMILVVQTTFMKHLLNLYGNSMCLLDSTYNTTKYTVSLSFVCVKTNCGYQPVAVFMLPKETTNAIEEALHVIAGWNPGWNPTSWITDYDQREISALERVFPDASVFLCAFHTEQAWQRWLRAKRNGCVEVKEELLKQMRTIRRSKNEEDFETAKKNIRDTDTYKNNSNFRNWIDKYWLAESERWVMCFISDKSITTTNGLERQHGILKENFLKDNGFGGTLTSLFTILVNKFFTSLENRYTKVNVLHSTKCRKPHDEMPEFLKGKPPAFAKHCIKRMFPFTDEIDKTQITANLENHSFQILSTTGNVYEATFDERIPKCSCPDFSKSNWPCKHILSICQHFEEFQWEKLNTKYTGQACFMLDESLQKNTVDETQEYDCKVNKNETVKKTDNIIDSPNKIRKTCFELMKNVEQTLFSTDDICVLTDIRTKLEGLDKRTHSSDTINDLKKRRKVRFNQKSNLQKVKRIPVNSKRMDSFIPTDEDDKLDLNTIPGRVEQIWRASNDTFVDYQIGKVGPYILTTESIRFLQTTLSDEVIDAYLYLLCTGKPILPINCVIMTHIFDDNRQIKSLLYKEDVYKYEYCIGAINQGGSHWTLLVIRPASRKLFYMNPLGERSITMQMILQRWYAFLHARYDAGVENSIAEQWTVESPIHAKQPDSISCGVFVLELAKRFLTNESLTFTWSESDITHVRKTIAVQLLNASEEQRCKDNMTDDSRELPEVSKDETKTLPDTWTTQERKENEQQKKKTM